MQLERMPKRELIALVRRNEGALAAGRRKAADVRRLAATLRQSAIDRAVSDLMRNPETALWRADAIVAFVFGRQSEIGLRQHYALTTLDRIVRRAIKKCSGGNSQPRT